MNLHDYTIAKKKTEGGKNKDFHIQMPSEKTVTDQDEKSCPNPGL